MGGGIAMPWYDFRCEACAQNFEARLAVAERDAARCPHCGSARVLRRLPLSLTVLRGGRAAAPEPCACDREGGCACAAAEAGRVGT